LQTRHDRRAIPAPAGSAACLAALYWGIIPADLK
jgi:hypothetical protein